MRGSSIEVDADSVSSEWTTDSEDQSLHGEDVGPSRKRRQKDNKVLVRKWRVCHHVSRPQRRDAGRSAGDEPSPRGRASSDSGSEASSSSTGDKSESSSSSIEAPPRPPLEAKYLQSSREAVSETLAARLAEARSAGPGRLLWLRAAKAYRCLGIAPGFLGPEEIAAIVRAARHPSVKEIHDRKGYLAFKHRVVRFEMQFRALEPALYRRLMELMRSADAKRWRRLRKKSSQVYPEVEYIEYDCSWAEGPCYIEPHVDNHSAVTLVLMLSPSGDYEGGRSCFRRSSGRGGHRELALEQGDAVLFRGEKLLHWITPVTSGRREILQIETSRV